MAQNLSIEVSGGLGIKNPNIMNVALLSKVAWRILTQLESLFSYHGNRSFVWNSISN